MKRYLTKALQILKWIAIVFFSSTLLVVLLYTFIDPPLTPLMLKRVFEQKIDGREARIEKQWVDIEKVSPNMVLALVSAEDNKFADHFGIDLEAIEKAQKHNKRSKRKWGASTISQQTAKNVFLWPNRSWVRKGFELYFTTLIEVVWSKKRIMEVYINVIEMGDGIYGVEAASKKYFKKKSLKLTRSESALLTSILPSPLKRNPMKPTPYMYRYQARVLGIMEKIGKVDF